MKRNNTFALIWDMDGTMVDTREAHWLAWKQSLAAENYDLDWKTFLKTFGQRNDTILRSLLGAGLPDAEAGRIGDAKEQIFREVLKDNGVKLLPGSEQLRILPVLGQRAATMRPFLNLTSALKR